MGLSYAVSRCVWMLQSCLLLGCNALLLSMTLEVLNRGSWDCSLASGWVVEDCLCISNFLFSLFSSAETVTLFLFWKSFQLLEAAWVPGLVVHLQGLPWLVACLSPPSKASNIASLPPICGQFSLPFFFFSITCCRTSVFPLWGCYE